MFPSSLPKQIYKKCITWHKKFGKSGQEWNKNLVLKLEKDSTLHSKQGGFFKLIIVSTFLSFYGLKFERIINQVVIIFCRFVSKIIMFQET
jgi:hypothetical protein